MATKTLFFYVTGRGQFPFDMLRHDACWPADPESASYMHADPTSPERTHRLFTHNREYQLTPDRWRSFGWTMSMTRPRD